VEIRRAKLGQGSEADGGGAVVVIDVLRSFTTAAYAFAAGAAEILPVASEDEALRLRRRFPDALTMGARGGGAPIPGFDLSNSPAEVAGRRLAGRRLIHCTAGGSRALVEHRAAQPLLAASLVCARATAALLGRLAPPLATLVTTGEWIDRDGEEDHACADYLAALLAGDGEGDAGLDPAPYVARVRNSDFGRRFVDPASAIHPAADLDCAAAADRFAFAMRVVLRDDDLVMTAVSAAGADQSFFGLP
jgi:2-phosphosulfolactate phosphatase